MADLYYEPTMYGISDVVVAHDDGNFRARIYYPSDAGTVFDVPVRPGSYPLVAFAHGQRIGGGSDTPGLDGTEPGCPEDASRDFQRWNAVLHLLARCGVVVVVPALMDVIGSSGTEAEDRLEAAIRWVRQRWEHRAVVSRPNVFVDPDQAREAATAGHEQAEVAGLARLGMQHLGIGIGTDASDILTRPTELGLVGHSWGARVCARVAIRGQVRVRALAAIAGTFDDDDAVNALIDARDPTLLMAGTRDTTRTSYVKHLWPSLVAPKHQALLQGIGHWDWFGTSGGIQYCEPDAERPNCRWGWLTASELLAGFMTKYLRNLWYLVPPHLLGYRGLLGSEPKRPDLLQWYEPPTPCGLKIRWDDPMALTDRGQVKIGEITRGTWTEPDPW